MHAFSSQCCEGTAYQISFQLLQSGCTLLRHRVGWGYPIVPYLFRLRAVSKQDTVTSSNVYPAGVLEAVLVNTQTENHR